MDIVYPLGKPGNWGHNELKFSLRSFEKFAPKFDNVFIIGEPPAFASDLVIHHAHKDPHKCKERNIMDKIMFACNLPDVSETFLLAHDDHFLLTEFSVSKFPFFYQGTLWDYLLKGNSFSNYFKSVSNTHDYLSGKGLPMLYFDVHTPILISKKKFKKAMAGVDWSIDHGYVIKSLYANALQIEGEPIEDCKITKWTGLTEIKKKIDSKRMFSTFDSAISQDLKDFLQKTFPTKSRFEK